MATIKLTNQRRGQVDVNSNRVTNVSDGTGNNDAVNLGQLNAEIAGITDNNDFVTAGNLVGGTLTLTISNQSDVEISGFNTGSGSGNADVNPGILTIPTSNGHNGEIVTETTAVGLDDIIFIDDTGGNGGDIRFDSIRAGALTLAVGDTFSMVSINFNTENTPSENITIQLGDVTVTAGAGAYPITISLTQEQWTTTDDEGNGISLNSLAEAETDFGAVESGSLFTFTYDNLQEGPTAFIDSPLTLLGTPGAITGVSSSVDITATNFLGTATNAEHVEVTQTGSPVNTGFSIPYIDEVIATESGTFNRGLLTDPAFGFNASTHNFFVGAVDNAGSITLTGGATGSPVTTTINAGDTIASVEQVNALDHRVTQNELELSDAVQPNEITTDITIHERTGLNLIPDFSGYSGTFGNDILTIQRSTAFPAGINNLNRGDIIANDDDLDAGTAELSFIGRTERQGTHHISLAIHNAAARTLVNMHLTSGFINTLTNAQVMAVMTGMQLVQDTTGTTTVPGPETGVISTPAGLLERRDLALASTPPTATSADIATRGYVDGMVDDVNSIYEFAPMDVIAFEEGIGADEEELQGVVATRFSPAQSQLTIERSFSRIIIDVAQEVHYNDLTSDIAANRILLKPNGQDIRYVGQITANALSTDDGVFGTITVSLFHRADFDSNQTISQGNLFTEGDLRTEFTQGASLSELINIAPNITIYTGSDGVAVDADTLDISVDRAGISGLRIEDMGSAADQGLAIHLDETGDGSGLELSTTGLKVDLVTNGGLEIVSSELQLDLTPNNIGAAQTSEAFNVSYTIPQLTSIGLTYTPFNLDADITPFDLPGTTSAAFVLAQDTNTIADSTDGGAILNSYLTEATTISTTDQTTITAGTGGAGALLEFIVDGEVAGLFFTHDDTNNQWVMNNGFAPAPDGINIPAGTAFRLRYFPEAVPPFNNSGRVPFEGSDAELDAILLGYNGVASPVDGTRYLPLVANAELTSAYVDTNEVEVTTVVESITKRRDAFGPFLDLELNQSYRDQNGNRSNIYEPLIDTNARSISLQLVSKVLNSDLYTEGNAAGTINIDGKEVRVPGTLDGSERFETDLAGDVSFVQHNPLTGFQDGFRITYTDNTTNSGTRSSVVEIPGVQSNRDRIRALEGGGDAHSHTSEAFGSFPYPGSVSGTFAGGDLVGNADGFNFNTVNPVWSDLTTVTDAAQAHIDAGRTFSTGTASQTLAMPLSLRFIIGARTKVQGGSFPWLGTSIRPGEFNLRAGQNLITGDTSDPARELFLALENSFLWGYTADTATYRNSLSFAANDNVNAGAPGLTFGVTPTQRNPLTQFIGNGEYRQDVVVSFVGFNGVEEEFNLGLTRVVHYTGPILAQDNTSIVNIPDTGAGASTRGEYLSHQAAASHYVITNGTVPKGINLGRLDAQMFWLYPIIQDPATRSSSQFTRRVVNYSGGAQTVGIENRYGNPNNPDIGNELRFYLPDDELNEIYGQDGRLTQIFQFPGIERSDIQSGLGAGVNGFARDITLDFQSIDPTDSTVVLNPVIGNNDFQFSDGGASLQSRLTGSGITITYIGTSDPIDANFGRQFRVQVQTFDTGIPNFQFVARYNNADQRSGWIGINQNNPNSVLSVAYTPRFFVDGTANPMGETRVSNLLRRDDDDSTFIFDQGGALVPIADYPTEAEYATSQVTVGTIDYGSGRETSYIDFELPTVGGQMYEPGTNIGPQLGTSSVITELWQANIGGSVNLHTLGGERDTTTYPLSIDPTWFYNQRVQQPDGMGGMEDSLVLTEPTDGEVLHWRNGIASWERDDNHVPTFEDDDADPGTSRSLATITFNDTGTEMTLSDADDNTRVFTGGGGTNVVANPDITTEPLFLDAIRIGTTDYIISQATFSGGDNLTFEEDFSGLSSVRFGAVDTVVAVTQDEISFDAATVGDTGTVIFTLDNTDNTWTDFTNNGASVTILQPNPGFNQGNTNRLVFHPFRTDIRYFGLISAIGGTSGDATRTATVQFFDRKGNTLGEDTIVADGTAGFSQLATDITAGGLLGEITDVENFGQEGGTLVVANAGSPTQVLDDISISGVSYNIVSGERYNSEINTGGIAGGGATQGANLNGNIALNTGGTADVTLTIDPGLSWEIGQPVGITATNSEGTWGWFSTVVSYDDVSGQMVILGSDTFIASFGINRPRVVANINGATDFTIERVYGVAIQGPRGEIGIKGADGNIGQRGLQGNTGPQGDRGFIGPFTVSLYAELAGVATNFVQTDVTTTYPIPTDVTFSSIRNELEGLNITDQPPGADAELNGDWSTQRPAAINNDIFVIEVVVTQVSTTGVDADDYNIGGFSGVFRAAAQGPSGPQGAPGNDGRTPVLTETFEPFGGVLNFNRPGAAGVDRLTLGVDLVFSLNSANSESPDDNDLDTNSIYTLTGVTSGGTISDQAFIRITNVQTTFANPQGRSASYTFDILEVITTTAAETPDTGFTWILSLSGPRGERGLTGDAGANGDSVEATRQVNGDILIENVTAAGVRSTAGTLTDGIANLTDDPITANVGDGTVRDHIQIAPNFAGGTAQNLVVSGAFDSATNTPGRLSLLNLEYWQGTVAAGARASAILAGGFLLSDPTPVTDMTSVALGLEMYTGAIAGFRSQDYFFGDVTDASRILDRTTGIENAWFEIVGDPNNANAPILSLITAFPPN